ncbi:MAG TPA: hypothetical protein VN495_02620 [Candidatus Paceibacterota bacterium]|nr:hypothetical protein [Candidatus Paceibacterota bacterium]
MSLEKHDQQEQSESIQELRALQQELAPIFDTRFATFGHGTIIDKAPSILAEGLRAETPLLQSTVIPLEDTPRGMKTILHWPHNDHKAVIVVSIPNDAPTNAEFFDPRPTESHYDQPYVLPPRFIRGYIDVAERKFVPNPAFEEHPMIKTRSPEQVQARLHAFDAPASGPVDIPKPKEDDDSVVDVF